MSRLLFASLMVSLAGTAHATVLKQCINPSPYDLKLQRECKAAADLEAAVASAPKDRIYLPDSDRIAEGRADRFNAGSITVTDGDDAGLGQLLFTPSVTFNLPTYITDRTRPRHTTWERASIASCDEYAYKRFYDANRYLESLANYGNDHLGAFDLVVSANSTRSLSAPAGGTQMLDYANRGITTATGTNLATKLAPNAPGYQVKNAFFGAGSLLASFSYDPDPAWRNDLGIALLKVAPTATPLVYVGNHWTYARDKWNAIKAQYPDMKPFEIEDIARRLDAVEAALGRFSWNVGLCLGDTATRLSAVAPQLDLKTIIQGAITDIRVTDPIPFNADLDLLGRLLNTATRAAAIQQLTQVRALSATSTTGFGPTTLLLAKLDTSSLDLALQRVSSAIVSGTFDGEGPYCARALEAADRASHLLVAEKRLGTDGCIYSNRCDASPPRTVRDAQARLTEIVGNAEVLHDRCVRIYGNDLKGPTVPPSTSLADLVTFENRLNYTYAILLKEWNKAPHNSTWGFNALGASHGGRNTIGNNQFGAGYDYKAEWAIEPLEDVGGTTCKLAGHASGSLNAYVKMFGSNTDVVKANLLADTQRRNPDGTIKQSRLDAYLKVLDQELLNFPDDTKLDDFSQVGENEWNQELFTVPFAIGPIPASVKAGIGFNYGYRFYVNTTSGACSTSSPSLSLTGRFEPYAGVDAWLTVGVDLIVLDVGVKGELTLIEASLPFTSTLSVRAQAGTDGGSQIRVVAKNDLDLKLEELGGSISLYVRVLFIPFEVELFSWDGLKQRIPLWHQEDTLAVSAFPGRG